MSRSALLAGLGLALLAGPAAPAAARAADPADYGALIARYAAACRALSAADCAISDPVTQREATGLACLFDQLDERAGSGTAEAHVAWAEGFAATGSPPATGFPSTLGEQQTLVAAMIACRRGTAERR